MIQTATPTTTNLQETPQGGPVKKAGAAKKEPLGVFAKILAGLLRNTRGLSPETQGKAETVKTLQKNAPPEGGKALSRNRKKAPSPREEGEAGAVLAAFPEGNSPPAEKLLLRASPETAQGLKNEEKAPPDKLSPPVSPGSSKPKIREGELEPRFSRPAEAALSPREEAAPGALPAFLAETPPPETPADKRELSRNRKAAPSEEPRVMPEPSGKIPEN
ncbi:MAG: hypothetical protein LBT95_09880, partial [Treponema sp.]|nr:hypothetical protein [Treponema sp.]